MRVVVDTNVIVSGVLQPASKPGRILELLIDGRLDAAISTELASECGEVLKRPKFGLDTGLVNALVDAIAAICHPVIPIPQREVTSDDPADQFVIDLAITADAYIVTGNARHFARYPKAVSPAEFLLLLGTDGMRR